MPLDTARQTGTPLETQLIATGNSQQTAKLLFARGALHEFTTVPAGTGAILPVPQLPSGLILVQNSGANPLAIYPPVGGTINQGGVNSPFSLAAGTGGIFWAASQKTWYLTLSTPSFTSYAIVVDHATRNAIPNVSRQAGMLVWTQNTTGSDGLSGFWQLNPSPWTGTDSDWSSISSLTNAYSLWGNPTSSPGAASQIPVFGNLEFSGSQLGVPTTGLEVDSHYGVITTDTESSGAITVNLATSDWHLIVFTGNITSFTLSNVTVGQQFTLAFMQAASGGPYGVSSWFSGTINWVGSPYSAPTAPTTASAYMICTFKCISSGVYLAWWLGNTAA